MAENQENPLPAVNAIPAPVALITSSFDLDSLIVPTDLSIEETLLALERQIAHLPFEVCFVLTATGTVAVRTIGTETLVEFTNYQCAQAHDGYLTHNHPAGTGLSFLDIRTAHQLNLRQMRTVTNTQPALIHVLNRPDSGWHAAECENYCRTEIFRVQKKFHLTYTASEQEQADALKKAQRHLSKFVPKLINRLHLYIEQRLL